MNVQYAKEVIELPAGSGGKAETLLMRLIRAGHYVDAPCGGKGTCGRCRVRFVSEAPQPTANERRLLTEEERSSGVRLACEVRVAEACSLQLPVSREQEIDVLVTADAADGAIPSRTVDEGIPGQTAGTIHGQRDCVAMHSREDAAKIWGHSGKKRCGAAVDIGTTTLAATLYDLTDRKRIAAASSVNHQRAYGADVLSRIQAANEGAAEKLRLSISRDIDALLAGLVADAGIPDDAVEELVIVGNTTMCHLLRGLSCAGLGAAPFTPEDLSLWEGSGAELALSDQWSVSVTILPGISAFVGADIVAGIYALEMDREKNVLLLDIGTNGEMVLGNRERMIACATAAGPALEGARIRFGMRGEPGAIDHAALVGNTLSLSVIGGGEAVGICGSGLIDIAAVLLDAGMVNARGRLAEPGATLPLGDRIFEAEGQRCFRLTDSVYLTQDDIRQLQMAKGAIASGIELMAAQLGGGVETIDRVMLAGAFGSFIRPESACRIGLLPPQLLGRIQAIGNAAGSGARRVACSRAELQRAQTIADRAEFLELAALPEFQRTFAQSMRFCP